MQHRTCNIWSYLIASLMLLTVVPVLAQTSVPPGDDAPLCEQVIYDIMDSLSQTCAGTQRNEACYGNIEIEAQPVPDATDFTFQQEGDTASINDIQSFRLTPLNSDNNTWGVMLMRVQANLPDVLPGQNVTMLFFGDIQVVNTPVFDPANADTARPMQAVYFRTGISAASCEETPDSGFVIRTPEGAGEVQLTVNDVNIRLGSTVVVRVVDNSELEFNTVEGQAIIEAQGESQTATEGNRVRVPVSSALLPAAPPLPAQPIDPDALAKLPLDLIPTDDDLNEEPDLTPTPDLPDLPATGACVLATAQDVTVNVRAEPGTDASVVGLLSSDEILTVIGQNAAGDWYETARGWIAAFVVRTGGDCTELPVTFVPATPVPTAAPEPTPFSGRVAGDNEYRVTVNYDIFGQQHFLTGNISYPVGDPADNVNYSIINVPDFVLSSGYSYNQYLEIQVSCQGDAPAIDNAIASLPDGRVIRCTPSPTVYTDDSWTGGRVGIGWSEAFLAGNQAGYITWTVTLAVRDGFAGG